MFSDRIFGLVVLMAALAFIASATQIQTSFMSDPVGPKAFPMIVGAIAGLLGLSVGLFLLFKYALGLGLEAFSKGLFG